MELLIIIALMNFIPYTVFGLDKKRAVKGEWRISEKTLITLSLFGPLGALIGMHTFKHKTKKLKFTILVPLFLAIQAGAIIYINFIH